MMIQSVWKNLTGLEKDKSWSQLNTSGVTLNADLEQKLITKHQWLVHYMDKSTGTPPSLEEKKPLPPLLQQFWSVWNDCTMSLVFDDEFFCSRSAFKVTPKKMCVFIFISYYFVLFCFKYEIRFVLNIVFNHFDFRFRYFSSSS